MGLSIRRLTAATLAEAGRCERVFHTAARLSLTAREGVLDYSIVPIPPREKRYPPEPVAYAAYVDSPDQAVYLADWDGALGGEARVRRGWNGYAYLEDLVVADRFRRRGLGRALVAAAIDWARAAGLPGVMLETQDINVAACQLYAACGFRLLGFDAGLYRATLPGTDEIALYWYLDF